MRKLFLGLFLASGCAWSKPVMNRQAFAADKFECEEKAWAITGDNDHDLYVWCMQAKGYTWR